MDHFPSATSIPLRIISSLMRGILPTSSVEKPLSKLTICETFATESFGNPLEHDVSRRFPGASAQRRLVVNGTQTTVAIRLRFNPSPCTTTTGLRSPGPEPAGSGRSAHQSSPVVTTTRFALECGGRPMKRTRPSDRPIRRRLDPCNRLCHRARAVRRTL